MSIPMAKVVEISTKVTEVPTAKVVAEPTKIVCVYPYHIFCKENRAAFEAANNGLGSREITKLLAAEWINVKNDKDLFAEYKEKARKANEFLPEFKSMILPEPINIYPPAPINIYLSKKKSSIFNPHTLRWIPDAQNCTRRDFEDE